MSNKGSSVMTEPRSALCHQAGIGKSVPSLLATRQAYGNLTHRRAKHRSSKISPFRFSSSVAWNTSRMQNMILAVGPGTPATYLFTDGDESSSLPSSTESQSSLSANEHTVREEELEQEMDESTSDEVDVELRGGDEPRLSQRANWFLRALANREAEDEREGSHEDNDPLEFAQRAISEWMDTDSDSEGDDDEDVLREASAIRASRQQQPYDATHEAVSSMRHGGCINTACWLECPWRLSLAGRDPLGGTPSSISSNDDPLLTAVSTHDCPTQIVTSGDDRVVKFWDVRYAMGSSSPLPGGIDTVCPFSAPTVCSPQSAVKEWKQHQQHCNNPAPGMVLPLATLSTGHRGNVFHITPLDHYPGKIATCGADGYLRVSDLQSSSPTGQIIVSSDFDDDEMMGILPGGLLSLRPGVCFSHHFLNANTGLLCSERGLRRFDLRLNPREQQRRSIIGGAYQTCKACAIWSASSSSSDDVESAYVFAGGSSGDVALYDLRMTDGAESKVVQQYRPRSLSSDASMSVSGLDISMDKRELLVSYENDQIYSFPIFPHAKSIAGPTVDELTSCWQDIDDNEGETSVVSELASYGGHLNRFTFLKNAKFAGPKDEYICTGSDSGHAWIYERESGAVAALLNADRSTCNGVVPHPKLPFFITYGIDSTAKLWRATIPVDSDVDDSPLGRARCSNMQNYEKSPVVRNWTSVQSTLLSLERPICSGDFHIMPDQISSREEEVERSIFESIGGIVNRRRREGPLGHGGSNIGNNLQNLPAILCQNFFACVRAKQTGEEEPVRSGLVQLKRRMSTIRLRHQADSHGLMWNYSVPWIMQPRDCHEGKNTLYLEGTKANSKANNNKDDAVGYGHLADLVPDKPSDWIPFDLDMTSRLQKCGVSLNTDDYADICEERYGDCLSSLERCAGKYKSPWMPRNTTCPWPSIYRGVLETNPSDSNHAVDTSTHDKPGTGSGTSDSKSSQDDIYEEESETCMRSWAILQDTVSLLKESGNAAMQEGAIAVAARRYDKAISYCAVAFMWYPNGNHEFVTKGKPSVLALDTEEDGHTPIQTIITKWVPLLKVLLITRLNLAMAMLKPQLADPWGAADQANQALHELQPFCSVKGEVIMAETPCRNKRDEAQRRLEEPPETFQEAKVLQAKAYFRLGTAQHALKNFAGASKSFEHSIKSTKDANTKPDASILRRLAEANRENAKTKKRYRRRFKRMLSTKEDARDAQDHPKGEENTRTRGRSHSDCDDSQESKQD